MELIELGYWSSGLRDFSYIFSFIGVIISACLILWCYAECSFESISDHKALLIFTIVIVLATIGITLFGNSIVQPLKYKYLVNDINLLEEQIDNYKIVNVDGKIYTVIKK